MIEYRPLPEYNQDGSEKHVVQDGARYHVISWGTLGQRCSEPNCEINRKREKEARWAIKQQWLP